MTKKLVIGCKTCMKCGKNAEDLNENHFCSRCKQYCLQCGKKQAEFGITEPKRCIDCRFLGDKCVVKQK